MHGGRRYILDLTLLKITCIMLVVLGLSTTMVFERSNGGTLESVAMRIYKVSELLVIPLFVMISGYLHRMTRRENGKRRRSDRDHVRRRSVILLSNYLIFGVLTVGVNTIVGDFSPREAPAEFLDRILLGMGPYHLWFILMLLWVNLSYHFLESIFRRGPYLSISVLSISLLSPLIPTNLLQLKMAGLFLLIYHSGSEMRYLETGRSPLVSLRAVPVYAVSFFLLLSAYFRLDIGSVVPSPLDCMIIEILRVLISITGSVSIIIISRYIFRDLTLPGQVGRFLHTVSSHILGIYLLHLPVMVLFLRMVGVSMAPLWTILISFFFTIAFSFSLLVVLEKVFGITGSGIAPSGTG